MLTLSQASSIVDHALANDDFLVLINRIMVPFTTLQFAFDQCRERFHAHVVKTRHYGFCFRARRTIRQSVRQLAKPLTLY
jgi:hypothetical protein